jgi:zinc transport system ATP-binding protein
MALISCRDVSFAYESDVVISGLNFQVNRGDYLCIVGENGSGKSTLINGLLRLKAPFSGEIAGGGDFIKESGYLPQQTSAQRDFPAGVYEVVLSGRIGRRGLSPFYSKSDKKRALENMERLNIGNLRDKCYRELSGGQQQRVLLARALCAADTVLLLDEPAGGLDPLITRELYREIEKINHETGITVIMVSHDIAAAVKYASHILHLNNCQMFFGLKEDYVKTPLGAGFLGAAQQSAETEYAYV